ncbi:helix-turn-helix domain-containing protein [Peribacillus frigoritolerans]|uniref:helix-turn-helix domain-containing protein n=1 Tax=Peribacillus frigoritolerans TaxID=450367 RepID=UPI0025708FFE|nr:helix-turn-helix transcriptional regulator [Peribacillus frigoritolerans]
MTKKQLLTEHAINLGNIIKEYRLALSLEKKSRQYFIDDRINKQLLPVDWISEKSLSNIENGYNMPSLVTLKYLSVALEVDFSTLINAIEEYILPSENSNRN